jgi:hypothetical protein
MLRTSKYSRSRPGQRWSHSEPVRGTGYWVSSDARSFSVQNSISKISHSMYCVYPPVNCPLPCNSGNGVEPPRRGTLERNMINIAFVASLRRWSREYEVSPEVLCVSCNMGETKKRRPEVFFSFLNQRTKRPWLWNWFDLFD